MQITLEQNDIEQAIKQYLGNEGLDVSRMDITVDLIAGRGGNGHRAEVRLVKREMSKVERVLEARGPDTVIDAPASNAPEPLTEETVSIEETEEKASLFN